jgi:hypothetical protein
LIKFLFSCSFSFQNKKSDILFFFKEGVFHIIPGMKRTGLPVKCGKIEDYPGSSAGGMIHPQAVGFPEVKLYSVVDILQADMPTGSTP